MADADNRDDGPPAPGRGRSFLWYLAGGALLFLAGRFWRVNKWIVGTLWSGVRATARMTASLFGAGR